MTKDHEFDLPVSPSDIGGTSISTSPAATSGGSCPAPVGGPTARNGGNTTLEPPSVTELQLVPAAQQGTQRPQPTPARASTSGGASDLIVPNSLATPATDGPVSVTSTWVAGTPYAYREYNDLRIKGHPLPEPTVRGKSRCLVNSWEHKPKSADMQVKCGILVYKRDARKYLIVRVQVRSGGQMVHGVERGQHEDRYCGYYEESLQISVLPKLADGETLDLEDENTFPGNDLPSDLDVKTATGELSNWKLELNAGGSVNVVKGPAATFGGVAGIGGGKTNTTEVSGRKLKFQKVSLGHNNDGGWIWEKKLALHDDGTPYPPLNSKNLRKIPPVPDLATKSYPFDIQGMWSLPEGFEEEIEVQIGIQQVLAYAAITPAAFGSTYKVCQDKGGCGSYSEKVSVASQNLDKVVFEGQKLPFTFGRK